MKKDKVLNILFFVIIFIIILLITLSRPLSDLDEIWNYNIARNIASGLIPYKDISMITSPLLAMVTAIFLKLTFNELIVTRILSSILATLILYSLYKTMETLKIESTLRYLVITLLLVTLKTYFCLDYNWFVALIAIIIVNLELKNLEKKEHSLKYEFLIGCLVGISICIKQSIGALIAIVTVVYNLMFIEDIHCIKIYIKHTLIRICGIIVPVFILFIYLYIHGALYSFIDYCLLGITTFSNSIPYIKMITGKNIYLKILAILIPVMYFVVGIKIIINLSKSKDIKILFTLLTYGIALFAVTFPISNDIHFYIGTLISMVLLVYLVHLVVNKYLKIDFDNFPKIYIYLFLIILLIYSSYEYVNVTKENIVSNEIKHFKYIPTSEWLLDYIKEMDEYILNCNKKVYILDSDAALYMIPIDRYNKDYDMFNLGNFGARGEGGKIEDLENEENVILLLRNNQFSRNWQHPENVRKYIEENWENIGIIKYFDIYEKVK